MRQLRAGRLRLLILWAVSGLGALPAAAQLGELPQPVIQSMSVTPEQADAIQKYIAPRIADLESGEPAKLKRAREELGAPASNAGATIAFRTAYGEALTPELDRLGKSENDVVVIGALHIAGALATGPAIELTERYRADSRPAVRYAAIFGLRSTLRSISRSNPVVGTTDIERIVDNLAAGLGAETDPNVADGYVRALLEASRVQADKFEAIPNRALGELARGVGVRVRKLGGLPGDLALLPAFMRASEAIRDVVAADVLHKNRPDSLAVDAGGLGGDLLAYVFRRVRAGALPVARAGDQALAEAAAGRQVEITMARLGVTLVFSARDRLAVGRVEDVPDLAALLAQASTDGDRQFQQRVLEIIGDGGLLTKDPFRFNADRFLGGR